MTYEAYGLAAGLGMGSGGGENPLRLGFEQLGRWWCCVRIIRRE